MNWAFRKCLEEARRWAIFELTEEQREDLAKARGVARDELGDALWRDDFLTERVLECFAEFDLAFVEDRGRSVNGHDWEICKEPDPDTGTVHWRWQVWRAEGSGEREGAGRAGVQAGSVEGYGQPSAWAAHQKIEKLAGETQPRERSWAASWAEEDAMEAESALRERRESGRVALDLVEPAYRQSLDNIRDYVRSGMDVDERAVFAQALGVERDELAAVMRRPDFLTPAGMDVIADTPALDERVREENGLIESVRAVPDRRTLTVAYHWEIQDADSHDVLLEGMAGSVEAASEAFRERRAFCEIVAGRLAAREGRRPGLTVRPLDRMDPEKLLDDWQIMQRWRGDYIARETVRENEAPATRVGDFQFKVRSDRSTGQHRRRWDVWYAPEGQGEAPRCVASGVRLDAGEAEQRAREEVDWLQRSPGQLEERLSRWESYRQLADEIGELRYGELERGDVARAGRVLGFEFQIRERQDDQGQTFYRMHVWEAPEGRGGKGHLVATDVAESLELAQQRAREWIGHLDQNPAELETARGERRRSPYEPMFDREIWDAQDHREDRSAPVIGEALEARLEALNEEFARMPGRTDEEHWERMRAAREALVGLAQEFGGCGVDAFDVPEVESDWQDTPNCLSIDTVGPGRPSVLYYEREGRFLLTDVIAWEDEKHARFEAAREAERSEGERDRSDGAISKRQGFDLDIRRREEQERARAGKAPERRGFDLDIRRREQREGQEGGEEREAERGEGERGRPEDDGRSNGGSRGGKDGGDRGDDDGRTKLRPHTERKPDRPDIARALER